MCVFFLNTMYCYIKYSVLHVNQVRNVSTELSSDSIRKCKVKTRRASLNEKYADHQSSLTVEANGAGMTNHLVREMSIAAIKQKHVYETPDEENYTTNQQTSFLSSFGPKLSIGSLNKRERTVKMSAVLHPRSRSHSPMQKLHKLRTKTIDDHNDTLMINPDCYAQILLDYIYDTLNLYKNSLVSLDLCDDNGVVVGLTKLQPYENAKCRLQNRTTYNLVAIESHPKHINDILVTPLIAGTNTREREVIIKFRRPGPSTTSSATGFSSLRGTPRIRLPKKREIYSAKI